MEQEPGSDAEKENFCTTSYDVTFPVLSKIKVNGPARISPLCAIAWPTKGLYVTCRYPGCN
jgi:glutathione peroxidase-family protein